MFILATFWHFLVTSIWFLALGYGVANTGASRNSSRAASLPYLLALGISAQTVGVCLLFYYGLEILPAWRLCSIGLLAFSAWRLWLNRSDLLHPRNTRRFLDTNTALAILAVAGIGIVFQRMEGFGISGILIDARRDVRYVESLQYGLPTYYSFAQERVGASILVDAIKRVNRLSVTEALAISHFFIIWVTQWVLADAVGCFLKKRSTVPKWIAAAVLCAVFFNQLSWFMAFHGFLNQALFTLAYVSALSILLTKQTAPNLLLLLLINCLSFMSYSISMTVPLIITEMGLLTFYRGREFLRAIRSYSLSSWGVAAALLVFLSILFVPSYKYIFVYVKTNPEMVNDASRLKATDIHFFTELTNIVGLTHHSNNHENLERKEIRKFKLGGFYLTLLDALSLILVGMSMAAFFFIQKRLFIIPLIWMAFMFQFRLLLPFPYAYFKYTSAFSIAFMIGTALTLVWLCTKQKQVLSFCIALPLATLGGLQFSRNIYHFSSHGYYLAPAIPRLSKLYQNLRPACKVDIADSIAPAYWNYWMEELFPPFSPTIIRTKPHCILMTSDRFPSMFGSDAPTGALITDNDWGLFVPSEATQAQ